jgi:hypothetical protein
MKIPTLNKKPKTQQPEGKPFVVSDTDFQFDDKSIVWADVKEYRLRPVGPGWLEIITKGGLGVRVPRNVKVYYGQYPVALGPDPFPFLVKRIHEMNPGARKISVNDNELLALLIVLNAEIAAVILALFFRKNLGVMMLGAAVAGLLASFGVTRWRSIASSRVFRRK